jgi:hypothetical protein
VAVITNDYNNEVSKYHTELAKLKDQPPKVKEKLIRVYVSKKADVIVPKGFVNLHNTAAKGKPLSDIRDPNANQSSTKSLSDVGLTVAENYYTCNAIRTQLIALEKVVIDFQHAQKELTK